MTRIHAFLLVFAVLAAANIASFFTLSRNVVAGVYPIHADSILIPLAEGAIVSLTILALLCTAILLPRNKLGSAAGIILSGIALVFSVAYVIIWAIPDHYTMAAAYGCVAIMGGILIKNHVRQLTSRDSR